MTQDTIATAIQLNSGMFLIQRDTSYSSKCLNTLTLAPSVLNSKDSQPIIEASCLELHKASFTAHHSCPDRARAEDYAKSLLLASPDTKITAMKPRKSTEGSVRLKEKQHDDKAPRGCIGTAAPWLPGRVPRPDKWRSERTWVRHSISTVPTARRPPVRTFCATSRGLQTSRGFDAISCSCTRGSSHQKGLP